MHCIKYQKFTKKYWVKLVQIVCGTLLINLHSAPLKRLGVVLSTCRSEGNIKIYSLVCFLTCLDCKGVCINIPSLLDERFWVWLWQPITTWIMPAAKCQNCETLLINILCFAWLFGLILSFVGFFLRGHYAIKKNQLPIVEIKKF